MVFFRIGTLVFIRVNAAFFIIVTFFCTVPSCKLFATKTEPGKYSGSVEGDNEKKSSVDPDKGRSTDLKENSENSTEQASPVESDKFSFPWWIVAVIAAVVIGGGILAIVLIRKGSDE